MITFCKINHLNQGNKKGNTLRLRKTVAMHMFNEKVKTSSNKTIEKILDMYDIKAI